MFADIVSVQNQSSSLDNIFLYSSSQNLELTSHLLNLKSSEPIGTFLKKSAVVCLRSRPHYGPSADLSIMMSLVRLFTIMPNYH